MPRQQSSKTKRRASLEPVRPVRDLAVWDSFDDQTKILVVEE